MKKQIISITPEQTAKILIFIYLIFSVPIVFIAVLLAYLNSGDMPIAAIFTALVLNTIIGFILLWLACHVYNWLAARVGGIEIDIDD